MNSKETIAYKLRKINLGDKVARLFLIILSVASIYPVIFVASTSFRNQNDFYNNIWGMPKGLYLDNYVKAIFDGHIAEYFMNSIIITGISLVFILIISILSAYGLSRLQVPCTEIIIVILFMCQMLPQEAMLIPLYVICSKIGILQVDYLSTIIPYIGWSLSGSIIMLKVFFDTLPGELLEAARIDGCNEFQAMTRIVAPLMKPSILTVLMFAFCGCWGELMWAQQSTLLTDTGIPLTVGLLRFQGTYSIDWGQLTAAMVVVLVPLFIVFAFTQKYLVAGFTGGAVKG